MCIQDGDFNEPIVDIVEVFDSLHKIATEAMRAMSEIWEVRFRNSPEIYYPEYLPSFDEFVKDFAQMLELPEVEEGRLNGLHKETN